MVVLEIDFDLKISSLEGISVQTLKVEFITPVGLISYV